MDIAHNLNRLYQQVAQFEKKYHRPAGSVQLLAATKGRSIEQMHSAFLAGQSLFGENYVQEALHKMLFLTDPRIEWHFIGPIQTNKIKKIAEHFHWVHSVSSEKMAQRLNDRRPLHLPPLNICIEINLNHESTKSGIAPNELLALAHCCERLPRLKLRGLMAIPEPTTSFTTQREHFHQLALLQQQLRAHHLSVDTLSMGMSDDFEAAIAEGSTLIRIGRSIFGPRE